MTSQPLVALDIGSTKVACAVGFPHERSPGFELMGSSLVPYPTLSEAWLGDLLMVSRAIEQALEATAVRGDFHQALVSVTHPSLTSERLQVAITLGDEPMTVRAQDLERLQSGALGQALGVDREPLLVERLGTAGNGFEGVRDPRGLPATRLLGTFHIVTMPIAARRAIVQVVESAGLEVVRLTYTLPAALASVADEGVSQQRVLLIDVGGVTTDVGLFVEGVLHASDVVQWGGLSLATTIAKNLQVTMDQAVTWSLEGTGCRRREVRSLIAHHWNRLKQAIDNVLRDQPRPDATLVTGRGALLDGFAEWIEQKTGIHTSLGRSARLSRLGDLSRQVGLSTAIGLLEMITRTSDGGVPRSTHFFNRLIDRTRTILTEYF
jgi:cell division ATPase FtsA